MLMVADGWLTTSRAGDAAYAIISMLPAMLPNVAVLVAADTGVFGIRADGLRGLASSARVLQTNARGIVRLKYPLAGPSFLTAESAPSNGIRFDGGGDTMDAAFALLPLVDASIPANLRGIAAEIGQAAATGLRAAPLLDLIRSGAVRPGLAHALVRMMPADELGALAGRLLRHPADLALLQSAIGDDVWLRHALPELARWLADGRPAVPGHSLVSPAEDEAPLLPAGERGLVPAGLALQCLARRQVLPNRLACILATARDEGPYLLDWVSYHLSIGFEHIFLYTNDNQDGSDALLAALAHHGVITVVDNIRGPAVGPQIKAYSHALTMLPQILDYRWTAVLDVDEYLAFDTGLFSNIAELIALQECQPVDAIALCWAMFASMPGEAWSDDSSTTRFTRRDKTINFHVKSLFRTRLFWYTQPHFPSATLDAPFVYRTQDGNLHHHPGVHGRIAAFAEHPSAEQAWINHYFLRTAGEAIWKWGRGRGDWLAQQDNGERAAFLELVATTFLELARPEHLVDDHRILACARGQDAVRARLLALPGVAEADRAIKTVFASKLAQGTDAFLSMPPLAGESDAVRQFRHIVAASRA
jgi:hypothetical protein